MLHLVPRTGLSGSEPDPDRWESLGTPDVIELATPLR
jgi:hypothetical protein